MKEFREELIDFMVEHELSRVEMAELIGVSGITLCYYINNKSTPREVKKKIMQKKMKEYENEMEL